MPARIHLKHILLFAALTVFVAGAFFKISAASSFEISSPSENQVLTGSQVTFDFTLPQNIKITDYVSHPRATYGQGHIHVWLDQSQQTAANAIEVTDTTFTLQNLKYGPHTITAELVTNSHHALLPFAVSTVHFTNNPPPPLFSNSLPSDSTFKLVSVAIVLIIIALYFIHFHIKPDLKKSRKSKK